MTQKSLLFLLVGVAMVGVAQSDLLPFPTCFVLEMAFKTLGCAAETSEIDYCVYMALALRLQLETGEPLCEAQPCIGYEQTGKACTPLFPRSCRSSDRISDGVCPLELDTAGSTAPPPPSDILLMMVVVTVLCAGNFIRHVVVT